MPRFDYFIRLRSRIFVDILYVYLQFDFATSRKSDDIDND